MNNVSFLDVPLRRDTKRIGDVSEIRLMADLVAAGYTIAIPFGENARWDIVIEKDGVLARVQVKSGRLENGAIEFNCYSSHSHRGGPSCRGYTGQVEYFGVFCPEVDQTFLIPAEHLAEFHGSLRVSAPKNSQAKGIRWAEPYRLG